MKIDAYLIINNRGSLRLVKGRPGLNNNEIAVKLNIDVPREFFERLIPTVNIELPKEAVVDPSAETVLAITAQEISHDLQISVTDALDGLKDMVAKARGDEAAE